MENEDTEELSIEDHWEDIKDSFIEAGNEVLGPKRKNKEAWISVRSWELIDERKELKNQAYSNDEPTLKELYKEKHRAVKKSIAKDKTKLFEDKSTEAENAAARGDLRTLYQTTKELSGKFKSGTVPVKDSNSSPLPDRESQLKRWAEHFEKLLNRKDPDELPDLNLNSPTLNIPTNPPSKSEIESAINKLKAHKSGGVNDTVGELLKASPKLSTEILEPLLRKIWEKEEIPSDWTKGLTCKLPKKGDLGQCNNWRGITLLCIILKVFTRCILNRIKDPIDEKIRREQAGFRKGRSCLDQIFALRTILEETNEFQTPIFINFIDFEKAFDSIHRPSMWNLLRHYAIPEKIVRLIELLYKDFQCAVMHEGELSRWFKVKSGQKQGCLLSPLLFLIAIDWLTGIDWKGGTKLEDLDFADDLALLSSNFEDLQAKTKEIEETRKKIG